MAITARAAVLLFIIGLCCTSLSADAAKDAWKKCSKANDTETKLRECSVAIESGTLSKDVVAKALWIRASAYEERGDYDQAIRDLDESVKLMPSASPIVDTRGWQYVRKFDYKRAIQDFDQSIQLDPKNRHAYANRGVAEFLSGDFADAENDFAMSQRLAPKPVRVYPALERILAGLREAKEKGVKPDANAIKFEGDLTQWPGQIVAYYMGGISQDAVLHAAQVPFERERKWKLCQAYFFLGEHALIEGNREEAMELLQKGIDIDARSEPEYAWTQGELRNLRSLGNGQEAKRDAESKPAQQTESSAQTGKPDSKPADPELMSAVYFLDPTDQSLKPLPKGPAKVVSKHSGFSSRNAFIQIPGAASPFRLKSGHDLVFVVKCSNPESYELYPFQKDTDKREALLAKHKFGGLKGLNETVQKLSSIEMSTSKYGEMSYRFVVKALKPGEYGFLVQWDVYHFGVDPN